MPATPDELFAYLDSLGIAHKTVTHPAAFTVEEARKLWGAITSINDRYPHESERAAIAEPRRFNDNTTKDIHFVATKEIRLAAP
jgi:hypothetical protein